MSDSIIELSVPYSSSAAIEDQPSTTKTYESMQFMQLNPKQRYHLICISFMLSLSLIVFVVLPVVIDMPYYSYPWLNAGDVWKMFDPLFTVPLLYFLFDSIPINNNYQISMFSLKVSKDTLQKLIFMVSLGCYVEGHGLHTFTTIVKDPVKVLLVSQYIANAQTVYSWIRDDWEHVISHYIYLIGFVGCQCVILWRLDSLRCEPSGQWQLKERWLFHLSAVINGLLLSSIAINFPSGLAVVIPISLSLLFVYLKRHFHARYNGNWKQMLLLDGRYIIWHMFILGYVVWFFAFLVLFGIISSAVPDFKEKLI